VDDDDLVSSYTVSKAVIDALVTAAVKWAQDSAGGFRYHWQNGAVQVNGATATPIGQMLWHANWYHADGWVTDTDWAESDGVAAESVYEYVPLPGVPDPLLVLHLIDNYVYQTAGEPEEWRPTEAFGFVHALQGVAIGRLLHDSDLPWTLGEQDRDIFLRYGGPDPDPEPVDSDNAHWMDLHTRLMATGIPFHAATPQELRGRKEADGSLLHGFWYAQGPDLGAATIQVRLHGTDQEAIDGFDLATKIAHQLLSPRRSTKVVRSGRTVLILVTDHSNSDLDEWLDRVRTIFPQADASWNGRYSPPPTN
jgi:hypothetical protein